MTIGRPVRGLAAALVLTLAVGSVSAGPAEARSKRPIQVGKCAYINQATGEWEFYLAGEYIFVKGADGKVHTLMCLASGDWWEVQRGGATTSTTGTAPVVNAP